MKKVKKKINSGSLRVCEKSGLKIISEHHFSKTVNMIFLFFFILCLPFSVFAKEGHIVYLTWQKQPDTSITIHWISSVEDTTSEVSYVRDGQEEWKQQTGVCLPLPEGYNDCPTTHSYQLPDEDRKNVKMIKAPITCEESKPAQISHEVSHSNSEQHDRALEGKKQENAENKEVTFRDSPRVCVKFGLVHRVEITQLTPNTQYHFRIGNLPSLYTFQTMPAKLEEPIRFVAGGDVFHQSITLVKETSRIAAKQSPRFAVLGGDIAYSAQRDPSIPEDVEKWLIFLQSWEEIMVTPQGNMIPILPTTSNEDTKGRYGQTPELAPCFYALFSFPGKDGYNVLDFGDYMSFWLLDSGHTHPIQGKQAFWLWKSLETRATVPYKFAAYHVPAFPSVRSPRLKNSAQIRRNWVSAFDRYALTAAFEHHDHAYKRTKPIRYNKLDETGTVYLGDGGWGVADPRCPVQPKDRWYLAHTASSRHFHLITLVPIKNLEDEHDLLTKEKENASRNEDDSTNHSDLIREESLHHWEQVALNEKEEIIDSSSYPAGKNSHIRLY